MKIILSDGEPSTYKSTSGDSGDDRVCHFSFFERSLSTSRCTTCDPQSSTHPKVIRHIGYFSCDILPDLIRTIRTQTLRLPGLACKSSVLMRYNADTHWPIWTNSLSVPKILSVIMEPDGLYKKQFTSVQKWLKASGNRRKKIFHTCFFRSVSC